MNNALVDNPNIKVIFSMFEKLKLPERYKILAFLKTNGKLVFQIYDAYGDVTSQISKIISGTDIFEGTYSYLDIYCLLKSAIDKKLRY